MKRVVLSISILIATCIHATAQSTEQTHSTTPLRTEFISYDIRETAGKEDVAKNVFYVPLKLSAGTSMTANIDIPYTWLDRELFLRVAGLQSFTVVVNGAVIGSGEDSRIPSEFNISRHVSDGRNNIAITVTDGSGSRLESQHTQPTPSAYIFSQPKVRIEDFTVRFEPDSTGTHGIFDLEIIMSNSYNSPEDISVGFDVYSPEKLEHFDVRPFTLRANGRDTIRLSERIWRTPGHMWSESYTGLYHGMLIVKRGNRFVEYIPYKVGFGVTEYQDGNIYRNGKKISIKAVRYNSAADKKSTGEELTILKKTGYNTICTDYPQPIWVYDLCDSLGLYVIDQANINNGTEYGDKTLLSSLANNPQWLDTFLHRTQAMYFRAKNHSCIIGWSLGGEVGNGFNMYRSYLWLKEADRSRAVIFNDAAGEWNSDMKPIEVADGRVVIGQAPEVVPKHEYIHGYAPCLARVKSSKNAQ